MEHPTTSSTGREGRPPPDHPPADPGPGGLSRPSPATLAAHLLGPGPCPGGAAVSARIKVRLRVALNRLGPLDREVLTLRHLERLSNAEAARVLGLSEAACGAVYLRALRCLKEAL